MNIDNWAVWEDQFINFLQDGDDFDAGHGITHIRRVVANAKRLAETIPNAQLAIVIPAAWLHDCVSIPKNSPLRSQASRMAAEEACAFLHTINYPSELIPAIEHAIIAHSYTAQIIPETIEAKIVQDADRLDAIGAIGVARCLMVGTQLGSPLYHTTEPFPVSRTPVDGVSMIDHFYTKLIRLTETMQTNQGREEAKHRIAFMHDFLRQLGEEIGISADPSLPPTS